METAKFLYRLAWWFLFPVAYDSDPFRFLEQQSAPWSNPVEDAIVQFLDSMHVISPESETKQERDPIEVVVEEDHEEESDSDDNASTSSELSAVSSLPNDLDIPVINDLSLSVSSLAEAYHAHYAAQEYAPFGNRSLSSGYDDDNPSRLDYIITQMDVARMSKHASRHLDVQSILNLPVITFEAKTNAREQMKPKLSDSWTIVDGSSQQAQNSTCEEEQKQDDTADVCVICLEAFVPGDRLRVLPCNHSFHTGCIDRWLSGSQSCVECYTAGCPTCKENVVRNGETTLDGSVPSWAFAQVGSALYESSSLSACS